MSERVLSDATTSSESEAQQEETVQTEKRDENVIKKLGVRVKWALRSFIFKHFIGDCLANSEEKCKRLLNHYNTLDQQRMKKWGLKENKSQSFSKSLAKALTMNKLMKKPDKEVTEKLSPKSEAIMLTSFSEGGDEETPKTNRGLHSAIDQLNKTQTLKKPGNVKPKGL